MSPQLPSRIDRAAFDRVLQRAAELQAASKDIGDGLSEDEILALGAEVGIPREHLRQALLEERTHIAATATSGLLDRTLAPAEIISQRVVQGTPESIGGALTRWLNRQEHFVVQRNSGDKITYEPMETLAGVIRRVGAAFDPSRAKSYLDKADLVTAVITPLETGFCHVTMATSMRRTRAALVGAGSAIGIGGMLAGAALVALGAPLVIGIVAAGGMMIGGAAIASLYRGRALRSRTGLERALDDLERNPALPASNATHATPLARGVGSVVREVAQEVRRALKE